MAWYPGSDGERRVDAQELSDVCRAIFAALGMNSDDAALLADSLVAADLGGVHSHGVLRVPEYADKLTHGVDPRGRPRVVGDRAAALVIDGGNAMGQVACAFAMRAAIERARTAHVAIAAVRGSNHCGALSYYTGMAARAGMIGLAASNALPTMAPWGGTDKILGINPFAATLPGDAEHDLAYDAAFSESSHGRIRVFAQKGASIPRGWATDAEGHPTEDPLVAMAGLLQPIGGHKGTGLAIVWGALSTLLSGAAFGTALGDMERGATPGVDGQIMVAIDIAGFCDPADFRARVDAIVRQVTASKPAPGVAGVWAPGGMEAEARADRTAHGIPLNAETLDAIAATATRVGVGPVPWAA